MFGQSQQQPSTGFGGFGQTTGTTGGHQRTNTSLFAPATSTTNTSTTGLFGASTSTAPSTATAATATPSLGTGGFGGFGNTTTANPGTATTGGFGFGNATTAPVATSAAATAPATGGLFGSTNTGGLKFGTGTTAQPTTNTNLFGSTNTSTNTTGASTSLFGGASNFSTSTQQQQQQQQQSDSLLSLRTSFPDTNVPYFIIKPDKVQRTSIPPSLFNKDDQTTSKLQQDISSATSSTSAKSFGAQRTTLPGFLTSATASVNSTKPSQKRAFEDQNESERRTLYKHSSNNSGIFGMHGDESFGVRNSGSTKEIDEPPVVSIWDIGVNPRQYSALTDRTKTSNKPDVWTLAISQSQNNTGKLSFISQDNNNSNAHSKDRNNNLLSSTMHTATTCTARHHYSNTNNSSNDTKGPRIIKVFGYPSEAQVAVIEFFTGCGKIEERYQSNSNWMTFRYEKSEGAKEALSNHGKIITKDCMVGVVETKTMTG